MTLLIGKTKRNIMGFGDWGVPYVQTNLHSIHDMFFGLRPQMISIVAAIFMMDMIATHVDTGYNAHDEG